MPTTNSITTPGLASFLKSLKGKPVESSIEEFISLLKRRQIRNSRPCAIATIQLLLRVISDFKGRDAEKLLSRVRHVGQRLTAAQPREMAVGNIVRRVLSLIRSEAQGPDDMEMSFSEGSTPPVQQQHGKALPQRPGLSSSISTFSPLKHVVAQPLDTSMHISESSGDSDTADPSRPPLLTSHTSYASAGPAVTSLFGLFSHPHTPSQSSTPTGTQTPQLSSLATQSPSSSKILSSSDGVEKTDLKAEVIDGIREMIQELETVDDVIAEYAPEHIHSNEIILTHSSSRTVQAFLLFAAKKRKFTVIHAESYPNDHVATHDTILHGAPRDDGETEDPLDEDNRFKPLTDAGITVILIPDSAVFALMSRVNKVVLATHTVLANGSLVAASGAHIIAAAAKVHKTPVIVLSGVYKLSPIYPFDVAELIEYGDAGKVVPYEDAEFVEEVEVLNPLYDHVPSGLVDLYVTNLGACAPSYLYRIVADHYGVEDINL